jgi:hypothetical protein
MRLNRVLLIRSAWKVLSSKDPVAQASMDAFLELERSLQQTASSSSSVSSPAPRRVLLHRPSLLIQKHAVDEAATTAFGCTTLLHWLIGRLSKRDDKVRCADSMRSSCMPGLLVAIQSAFVAQLSIKCCTLTDSLSVNLVPITEFLLAKPDWMVMAMTRTLP